MTAAAANGHAPTLSASDVRLTRQLMLERAASAESIPLAAFWEVPGFADRYGRLLDPTAFDDPIRRALALETLEAIETGRGVAALAIAEAVTKSGRFNQGDVSAAIIGILEFTPAIMDERAAIAALRTLNEKKARLRMLDSLAEVQRDAETMNSAAIAERIETITASHRADSIAATHPLSDFLREDPAEEIVPEIRTGLPFWDGAMPDGAMKRGEKIAVSSQAGLGKSALALQVSLGAVVHNEGLNALWALGEMTPKTLRNRALQCLSGLPLLLLRRPWDQLSPLQATAKREAIEALRQCGRQIHILASPLTPARIEAAIIANRVEFAVVDYLQLMQPDKPGSSRRDEIDSVIRSLVRIAQAHAVTLLIISNQAKGAGRRDIWTAFKESSEIAYAVDVAFAGELIGHEDGELPDDLPDEVSVRWRCLKSRHGSPRSIVTRFDRPSQRFRGCNG